MMIVVWTTIDDSGFQFVIYVDYKVILLRQQFKITFTQLLYSHERKPLLPKSFRSQTMSFDLEYQTVA